LDLTADVPLEDVLGWVKGAVSKSRLSAGATVTRTKASHDALPTTATRVTPATGVHYQLAKSALQEYWRVGPDEKVRAAVAAWA
jgi:hypothetical protein